MEGSLSSKRPSASSSDITELMMPHHVNNLGNVFGGVLLSLIDRAAAVAAMRHSGRPSLTVSIDRVDFKEPIYAGQLVMVNAKVNYVGRTSMEIGVKVTAENPMTGESSLTNICFLTFVAIDDDHRPCRVPRLELVTEEDRQNFHDGQRRREVRRALDLELSQD